MNIYIPVEMCSLTVTEEIDGRLSLHVLRRVHTVVGAVVVEVEVEARGLTQGEM